MSESGLLNCMGDPRGAVLGNYSMMYRLRYFRRCRCYLGGGGCSIFLPISVSSDPAFLSSGGCSFFLPISVSSDPAFLPFVVEFTTFQIGREKS